MILIDVNVLVYAHRPDAEDHLRYRNWLDDALNSKASFGVSDIVLSSVVRVVTNPRIFAKPTPLDLALEFADSLRDHEACVLAFPGGKHWGIFRMLCRAVGARGNIVSDAFHAALAIESGAEWITADRDYARFPGLRWRHPFA